MNISISDTIIDMWLLNDDGLSAVGIIIMHAYVWNGGMFCIQIILGTEIN